MIDVKTLAARIADLPMSDLMDLCLSLSENGFLDDDGLDYFEMDCFDELFSDSAQRDVVKRAVNGGDDEGGAFNVDREYFRIDASDGSLHSASVEFVAKAFRDAADSVAAVLLESPDVEAPFLKNLLREDA